MNPLISLRNVSRAYQRGGERLQVLSELDLEMEEGAFYALMGPSGNRLSACSRILTDCRISSNRQR